MKNGLLEGEEGDGESFAPWKEMYDPFLGGKGGGGDVWIPFFKVIFGGFGSTSSCRRIVLQGSVWGVCVLQEESRKIIR